MTDITGIVTSNREGIGMDLHHVPPGYFCSGEVYELKQGDTLEVVDLIGNPDTSPGNIGYANLDHGADKGRYDAYYGIDRGFQSKGLVSTALRVLIMRLIESDSSFSSVDFTIPSKNSASLHVARSLGASVTDEYDSTMYLSLATDRFAPLRSEVQRVG